MTLTQQLAALAVREMACLHRVRQAQGLMEVRHAQLEALGVYAEYQAIHAAYAELLAADDSQEGLKRAVFIQWYYLAEPPCFSGIGLLDSEAERRVFTHLNELLQRGAVDQELTCMLRYYAYWDYAFDRVDLPPLPGLQAFVRQQATTESQVSAPPLRIHAMPARGGMGHYWLSWGGGALLAP